MQRASKRVGKSQLKITKQKVTQIKSTQKPFLSSLFPVARVNPPFSLLSLPPAADIRPFGRHPGRSLGRRHRCQARRRLPVFHSGCSTSLPLFPLFWARFCHQPPPFAAGHRLPPPPSAADRHLLLSQLPLFSSTLPNHHCWRYTTSYTLLNSFMF